jgi:NAD(P)-dependent dehydrogenase (short-subunit alcohol dehydrogenase family)
VSANRVALVAGAGAAGTSCARALSGRGFHVVVADSNPDAAEAAVEPLLMSGHSAQAHGIDLLDYDAVVALRDELDNTRGALDVLVHLVGGWRGSKTLDRESITNWNALHPPIVGTLATLTAVFGDEIRASSAGRVFMVTSTSLARPTAANVAYVTAKAAAEAWMGGLAQFFSESPAAAVTLAVKALLNYDMIDAQPDKEWPGYTHVDTLAELVASLSRGEAANGMRIDMTSAEYSRA